MITNRDIIIVGLQPWDIEMGSNCKNIAMELASQNRVLYVNRALDRITLLKNRNDKKTIQRIKSIKGEISDLSMEIDNLWVLNPRVILESANKAPAFLFRLFNSFNNKRIARAIRSAISRLNFKNPILFIDNDFFRANNLPELLKPEFSIYYIRDYLIEQPYFKKHGAVMEASIMRKVNMVVANSPYLAKYASAFNKNSFDIGQGCDFSLLESTAGSEVPDDMKSISKPVIGYVGALNAQRLDIELIRQIAVAKPEWNIVLVGGEDEEFQNSELHSLSNIYFLGFKGQEQLSAYMEHFDVCINPQQVNSLTVGNYPRKIDEYLFVKKPVVATYTEFMEKFKEYVSLCHSAEDYVKSISEILYSEDGKEEAEERKRFALSHSWKNSVEDMSRYYFKIKAS